MWTKNANKKTNGFVVEKYPAKNAWHANDSAKKKLAKEKLQKSIYSEKFRLPNAICQHFQISFISIFSVRTYELDKFFEKQKHLQPYLPYVSRMQLQNSYLSFWSVCSKLKVWRNVMPSQILLFDLSGMTFKEIFSCKLSYIISQM